MSTRLPGSDRLASEDHGGGQIREHRFADIFRDVLIVLSVISLFAGITAISQAIPTTTPWMSLTFLYFFAAVEGMLTSSWLDHPDRRTTDRIAYRAAEFLVIIIFVRLFTWTMSGEWPLLRFLRSYLLTPLALFDDTFFVIGLILTLLAWQRAVSLKGLFSRLDLDPAEISFYKVPSSQREAGNRPLAVDRSRLVTSFAQQWFFGAAVLIIAVALASVDLAGLAALSRLKPLNRLQLRPEMLISLTVYFFAGFMLLSRARLLAMDARWLLAGTTSDPGVGRSWHRASLRSLAFIALIAAFLPLGRTIAIGHIVEAIVEVLFIAFNFLITAFLALLSLVFPRAGISSESRTPLAPPTQSTAPIARESSELFAMLLSSLFWAVAIFVTVTALIFFLRDRGVELDRRLLSNAWRSFVGWLRSLWGEIGEQARIIRQAARRRTRPEKGNEAKEARGRRLIRVNALSPREQLRYLYLSMVRRAGERGLRRKGSDTPLEYAQRLKGEWQEAGEDVDGLTDAFLRARYSYQNIAREEVTFAREIWRRLRKRLRRWRSSPGAPGGTVAQVPPEDDGDS